MRSRPPQSRWVGRYRQALAQAEVGYDRNPRGVTVEAEFRSELWVRFAGRENLQVFRTNHLSGNGRLRRNNLPCGVSHSVGMSFVDTKSKFRQGEPGSLPRLMRSLDSLR